MIHINTIYTYEIYFIISIDRWGTRHQHQVRATSEDYSPQNILFKWQASATARGPLPVRPGAAQKWLFPIEEEEEEEDKKCLRVLPIMIVTYVPIYELLL